MNLKNYLNKKDIVKHQSSLEEIKNLWEIVERDINDSKIDLLSLDRRYAIIYQAALNLCRIIIHKSGYRVSSKLGHHSVTFQVALIFLILAEEKETKLIMICQMLQLLPSLKN